MERKIRIIMNPSSGRQTIRQTIDDIIGYLVDANALYRVDTCYTHKKNDAKHYAAEMKKGEYDLAIVVGGDGTVNEVVNGLMEGKSDTPLAILAAGTVNDFASFIGFPTDAYSFSRMLIEMHTKKVDVGKVGDQYFLNVAAGGLLTDIAYKVPSDSKTALGRMAYWFEGARDLPANIFKGLPVTIKSKDDSFDADAFLFIIANTTSVGGIKKLLPYASVDDGLLDVLIVSKIEFGGFLPLLAKLLIGDHLSNDNITYFQTSSITVSTKGSEDIRLDLDGEEGDAIPAVISCVPRALTLIIPPDEDALSESK
jgi:diacylglycerol kinase (ATP)